METNLLLFKLIFLAFSNPSIKNAELIEQKTLLLLICKFWLQHGLINILFRIEIVKGTTGLDIREIMAEVILRKPILFNSIAKIRRNISTMLSLHKPRVIRSNSLKWIFQESVLSFS